MHMLQSFVMRSHHILSKDTPHSEHGVQLLTSFWCLGLILIVQCVVPALLIAAQPCVQRQNSESPCRFCMEHAL